MNVIKKGIAWWKHLSASVRIMSLILAGACAVVGATLALRTWDVEKQKPRVLRALGSLAKEVSEEEGDLEPLLRVIRSGETTQDGYLNLTTLDTAFLGLDETVFRRDILEHSTVNYVVERNETEKVMSGNLEYQISGIGVLDLEGYLTEEKLLVKIPQLHSSYLRMNTHNIKSQYENSLLYTILGDSLPLPETDFSIKAFPERSWLHESKEENGMLEAFLEAYEGQLAEIYKEITVTRENGAQQVLIQGTYEDCRVFHMSVPADVICWFVKYAAPEELEEVWTERVDWQEETIELTIYMDDDNHVHRMDTTLEMLVDGSSMPVSIALYLKGERKILESIQLDMEIDKADGALGFTLEMNSAEEEERKAMELAVSMVKPYVLTAFRGKLDWNLATGESNLEYEINTPILAADGEHHLMRQNNSLEPPAGDVVDVFELNLIDFLKFSRDFHFNFLR